MSGAIGSASETIWDVIATAYGEQRHAREMLARDAQVTPATAENWLRRRCTPQVGQLVVLMASCDSLKAAIDRLVEESRCGDR